MPPRAQIGSAADLAKIVRTVKSHRRVLFRGQNVDKPLLPRIARIAEERQLAYQTVVQIERDMLQRFQRESVPFLRGAQPRNDWEWLSVAQHQGLPTRLLDWTANALAALWFAVASDPPKGLPGGVLWVLEVEPDHEAVLSAQESVFDMRRTFVFQPFHIDQRIAAQSGWFSVHRYSEGRSKFVPLDRHSQFRQYLTSYSVPRGAFDRVRSELRMLGVTQATIFPDLPGLCAEIQAACIGSYRPPATI
jgi:FRG domain